MKTDFTIRPEEESDREETERLVRDAFWNVYRPGCLEHFVLHVLRTAPGFVPELDLVMEKDGRLIGQTVFVRTELRSDSGKPVPIMTMGPICIAPEFQKRGYGKALLDFALQKAAALGCGAVCFEGNIGFYGKSGFRFARDFGLRYHGLPEGEDSSFFLCKELSAGFLKGVTGEYSTPEVYFVNEKEAEVFDRKFPPREKLKLPGQIF